MYYVKYSINVTNAYYTIISTVPLDQPILLIYGLLDLLLPLVILYIDCVVCVIQSCTI